MDCGGGVKGAVIKTFLRRIAYAALVVVVVLLICALVYGLVWLLNQLSPLITASATIVIAVYTWALRDSTNLLWKAGERHFELEGPFLHPIIQSHSTIAEGLKFFSMFNHPTSPVTPVASEARFTIRNVGRSLALLKSVAARMDHWRSRASIFSRDMTSSPSSNPVRRRNKSSPGR